MKPRGEASPHPRRGQPRLKPQAASPPVAAASSPARLHDVGTPSPLELRRARSPRVTSRARSPARTVSTGPSRIGDDQGHKAWHQPAHTARQGPDELLKAFGDAMQAWEVRRVVMDMLSYRRGELLFCVNLLTDKAHGLV